MAKWGGIGSTASTASTSPSGDVGLPGSDVDEDEITGGSKPAKRGRGDGSLSQPRGHAAGTDRVDMLQAEMAQLLSIHDIQLRELQASVYTRMKVPLRGPWGRALDGANAHWRKMNEQRQVDIRAGMTPENATSPGSKHLMLGVAILQQAAVDSGMPRELRDRITQRYEAADKSGTAFVDGDVIIATWTQHRDGVTGGLQFKLCQELQEVEAGIAMAIAASGGQRHTGPAPKGTRVRNIEKHIQGTWARTAAVRGSGARPSRG